MTRRTQAAPLPPLSPRSIRPAVFGLSTTVHRLNAARWIVFALLVLALGYGDLQRAEGAAFERYRKTPEDGWQAADVWISSAECMRRTGAWLVTCDGGRLRPIADAVAGDDPGHALLLGLTAWTLDRAMTLLDVARVNIAINAAGMVCLAALLFAVRSYVAAIIFLAWGEYAYLKWIEFAPHPGFIGAASFAAIFPSAVLLARRGYMTTPAKMVFVIGGAVLLGVAFLLREPIGMMGMAISLGALAVLAWRDRTRWKVLRLLPLLSLTILAWQTPRLVLLARDSAFAVPPTTQLEQHGLSHSLYLGLGAVENSFGLRWDDEVGRNAALKAEPGVIFGSREYFRIMWTLYFERVRENPREVARIYATKTLDILSYRLPDDGWLPLWAELAIAIGVMAGGSAFGLWQRLKYGQAPILVGVGLALAGLFILQGVLAHQSIGYARPVGVCVVLFAAIRSEFIARWALTLLDRALVRGVRVS